MRYAAAKDGQRPMGDNLTELERAVLATINAQKTRKQIIEESGIEEEWAKQLSMKQIAALHGIPVKEAYKIYYRKARTTP